MFKNVSSTITELMKENVCMKEKLKKTTTTLASLQFSTGMLEEEVLEKLEGKDHMLDSFD